MKYPYYSLRIKHEEVRFLLRNIIRIDQEKCHGCGLCVKACHEGAIDLIDGKAQLVRENYCDGLGDCLPKCPANAITFEHREALAYDQKAVLVNKHTSTLHQWPYQIKLMPIFAPYYHHAKLLIAADCSAYVFANMHEYFMKDRITLIGCPKLDAVDYSEKLSQIIKGNDILDILILRMDVACCTKLENAVKKAIQLSQKTIDYQTVVVSIDGKILKD